VEPAAEDDPAAAEELAAADELATEEEDGPAAEDDEPEAALLDPLALRQEVLPASMGKGADWTLAPVESFKVRLTD